MTGDGDWIYCGDWDCEYCCDIFPPKLPEPWYWDCGDPTECSPGDITLYWGELGTGWPGEGTCKSKNYIYKSTFCKIEGNKKFNIHINLYFMCETVIQLFVE